MKILLTNDDGIQASGLGCLRESLSHMAEILVVAPEGERSASSHSLTLSEPIRVRQLSDTSFALSGTPADCVLVALRELLEDPPDLVVSGINHGANLGDDIIYSGTVGAAREAAQNGIPSAAFSLLMPALRADFERAAAWAARLLQEVRPWERGLFLNVNIPAGVPQRWRWTRQGRKRRAGSMIREAAPAGETHYRIGPDESRELVETGTDYEAVREGLVSVTPLQRDQTDYECLKKWGARQPSRIPGQGP